MAKQLGCRSQFISRKTYIATERTLSLCDEGWHKLHTVPAKAPVFRTGKNTIIVTGTFAGDNGPVINCEFKATGSTRDCTCEIEKRKCLANDQIKKRSKCTNP